MINSALNRLHHDAAVTPRRGTRSLCLFQLKILTGNAELLSNYGATKNHWGEIES